MDEKQEAVARMFGVVHAFDDDSGLLNVAPDRLGFGALCSPLAGAPDALQDKLNGLLNLPYPVGTIIQFALYSSPDIEPSLLRYRSMRSKVDDPVLKAMTEERVAFLRQLTTAPADGITSGKLRSVQLMISVTIPVGQDRPTIQLLARIQELRRGFMQTLKSCGFDAIAVEPKHYLRFMDTIMNHGQNAAWRRSPFARYDDARLICNQILDPDTAPELHANGIALGPHAYMKLLSPKQYPDSVYFGQAQRYLGDIFKGARAIRDNVLITCTVYIPDQVKERSKLERQFGWTTRNTTGGLAKYVPSLGRQKRSLDIATAAVNDGDKIVKATFGIGVIAENEERAIEAGSAVASYFREVGFTMLEDQYAANLFLSQLLPFAADGDLLRSLMRYRTLTTRHVVPLLPVMGSWRGTGTPLLTLMSRDSQLMAISPWDSMGNYNVIVAAASGSGKSVMCNETIANVLACGGKAWAIDKGGSYEKLCRAVGGQYIEFHDTVDICMNPFTNVKSYADDEDLIIGILEAMATSKGPLDSFQYESLKSIVSDVFARLGNQTNVDDVITECLGHGDQRVKDIGVQLGSFSSRGGFGRYFNGRNNVNLNANFVVLELQQLAGRDHLRRVVLLQLMNQIQQTMLSLPRGLMKFVLVDEAWEQLSDDNPATTRILEGWYRQVRKFGGSAAICAQSVSDLYRSKSGLAMAENSQHMWLLAQNSESIDKAKSAGNLQLPDSTLEWLRSVHTVTGAYSEIMVRSGASIGIGRLVLSDFNKLLFSTLPQDVDAISHYRTRGLDVVQAIRRVMTDRAKAAAPAPRSLSTAA